MDLSEEEWRKRLCNEVSWERVLEQLQVYGWPGTWRVRSTGRIYLLCVTVHQEKTPSLVLFPQGRFHCYGCGQRGDILDFCFHLWFWTRVNLDQGSVGFLRRLVFPEGMVSDPNQLTLPFEKT